MGSAKLAGLKDTAPFVLKAFQDFKRVCEFFVRLCHGTSMHRFEFLALRNDKYISLCNHKSIALCLCKFLVLRDRKFLEQASDLIWEQACCSAQRPFR